MKATVLRNITSVTLELTAKEAEDLKLVAMFDSTIPAALKRVKCSDAASAAERVLCTLYVTLDLAGA